MAEAAKEAETAFATKGVVLKETTVVIPSSNTWKPAPKEDSVDLITSSGTILEPAGQGVDGPPDEEELVDMEHLQLTFQEAFFLIWTMGCLDVLDAASV